MPAVRSFSVLTKDFSPERRQRIEERKEQVRQDMFLAEPRKAFPSLRNTLAKNPQCPSIALRPTATPRMAYSCKTSAVLPMDAWLTISSKGQLVIPARLRQLLGLNPGDRLELSLQADGLLLRPHGSGKTSTAEALIGCTGYSGPAIPLEQQDPALFASRALP